MSDLGEIPHQHSRVAPEESAYCDNYAGNNGGIAQNDESGDRMEGSSVMFHVKHKHREFITEEKLL